MPSVGGIVRPPSEARSEYEDTEALPFKYSVHNHESGVEPVVKTGFRPMVVEL